jgi:hypothetical protein
MSTVEHRYPNLEQLNKPPVPVHQEQIHQEQVQRKPEQVPEESSTNLTISIPIPSFKNIISIPRWILNKINSFFSETKIINFFCVALATGCICAMLRSENNYRISYRDTNCTHLMNCGLYHFFSNSCNYIKFSQYVIEGTIVSLPIMYLSEFLGKKITTLI